MRREVLRNKVYDLNSREAEVHEIRPETFVERITNTGYYRLGIKFRRNN